LSEEYVKEVTDVVKVGDVVRAKVIGIDDQGRIKVSVKAAAMEDAGKTYVPAEPSAGKRDSGHGRRPGGPGGRGGRGGGRSEGRR
jgi:predicted RNA-binding protein with RPS1 domain